MVADFERGDTWRLRWGVNWGFLFNCRLLVLLHCGCWWIDSDGVKVRLGVDGEDAKVCLGIDSDGAEVSYIGVKRKRKRINGIRKKGKEKWIQYRRNWGYSFSLCSFIDELGV